MNNKQIEEGMWDDIKKFGKQAIGMEPYKQQNVANNKNLKNRKPNQQPTSQQKTAVKGGVKPKGSSKKPVTKKAGPTPTPKPSAAAQQSQPQTPKTQPTSPAPAPVTGNQQPAPVPAQPAVTPPATVPPAPVAPQTTGNQPVPAPTAQPPQPQNQSFNYNINSDPNQFAAQQNQIGNYKWQQPVKPVQPTRPAPLKMAPQQPLGEIISKKDLKKLIKEVIKTMKNP